MMTSKASESPTTPDADHASTSLNRPPTLWLYRLGLLLAIAMVIGIAIMPLTLREQFLFALASLGLSIILFPSDPSKRFRILLLVMISAIATARYIYWRFSSSLGWFDPNLELSVLDYIFSFCLLAAEVYAWITLFLGYFQTLWPLDRKVVPLPEDRSQWPTVDVFIPTYNEPLSIVSSTVLAATDLDYPADKLNVYLLDDGHRPEFAEFAKQANVHYLSRPDNTGAKAGNINYALAHSDGDLVAVFDSDHIPVHSFLTETVGQFAEDSKLGMLQTPHLFYTPDPIERNLNIFRKVPNENYLFYGLIQPGNDTWNASFFCGSCAILRREALEEVGGMSTASVTEDAYTSLQIHKKGWNSAYLRRPLAAGMATERLADHMGQRTRWAQGMVQMLRIDNPLFARGLSWGQRLVYLNSSLHFLFSSSRIVFLTAPLAFLFFNGYVLQASAAMIAVYAFQHIFQAHIASFAMQSSCRHSFWAEVYETLLAGRIFFPALKAFFFPRKPQFNVTRKGGKLDRTRFDWHSSRFVVFLLLINLAGIGVGIWRLATLDPNASGAAGDMGTLIITMLWTLYNSIILGAAAAVALEQVQRRQMPRLPRRYEVVLNTVDGRSIHTTTSDISLQGMGVQLPSGFVVNPGESVSVELNDSSADRHLRLPATIMSIHDRIAGLQLGELSLEESRDLLHFTHSRNDAWTSWYDSYERKRPLASLLDLAIFSLRGIGAVLFRRTPVAVRGSFGSTLAVWVFIGAMVIAGVLKMAYANEEVPLRGGEASPTQLALPGSTPDSSAALDASDPVVGGQDVSIEPIQRRFLFRRLASDGDIELRGGSTQNDIWFTLPEDEFIQSAFLKMAFSLSEAVSRNYTYLNVLLNDQLVGQIPIDATTTGFKTHFELDLPQRFLLSANKLSFRLAPRRPDNCPLLDAKRESAIIYADSYIDVQSLPIEQPLDLAAFPRPFFDPKNMDRLRLPFVIPASLQSSTSVLKAAGITASWFGALADYRHADFPVVSALPVESRYAVVLALPEARPEILGDRPIDGPSVMLLENPSVASGQLLVIMGRTGEELITAARHLIGTTFSSGHYHLFDASETVEIAERASDWIPAGKITPFSHLVDPQTLSQTGVRQKKIDIDLRLPADLFDLQEEIPSLRIVTEYEYRGPAPAPGSQLAIAMNGHWWDRISLDSREKGQIWRQEDGMTIIEGRHLSVYPTDKIYGKAQVSYYFDLRPESAGEHACALTGSTDITTSIRPGSYFDLRGMYHYARLPDLAKFANQGFPFTHEAGLRTTAIHLPTPFRPSDLHLMLNVLGRLGGASGVAATQFDVGFSSADSTLARQDNLLIGDFARQPLLAEYKSVLPLRPVAQNGIAVAELNPVQSVKKWLQGESTTEGAALKTLLSHGDRDNAAIMGFQIGGLHQRSGIALLASGAQADALAEAIIDDAKIPAIQGDVALLSEQKKNFVSARILPTTPYRNLDLLTQMRLFFRNYPLALILWMFLASLFGASMIYRLMQRRVAWRLHGGTTKSAT